MNKRVEALPKWKGFPIPYFATYRKDGTPDFKVVDEARRKNCAIHRVCWICGEALEYWVTFIGGPKSVDLRLFSDGPMHPECANDAMMICPFLLGQTDYGNNPDANKYDGIIQSDPHVSIAPTQMGILLTRKFSTILSRNGINWFFRPHTVKSVRWIERQHA